VDIFALFLGNLKAKNLFSRKWLDVFALGTGGGKNFQPKKYQFSNRKWKCN